jgi:hypothetical protein
LGRPFRFLPQRLAVVQLKQSAVVRTEGEAEESDSESGRAPPVVGMMRRQRRSILRVKDVDGTVSRRIMPTFSGRAPRRRHPPKKKRNLRK